MPYIDDIVPETLKAHSSLVWVANNTSLEVTHRGTVRLTLTDVKTGETVLWDLPNILVIPGLAKWLLSTDELHTYGHTMHFSAHCISFHLSKFDPEARDAYTTIISIPHQYKVNDDQAIVSWPQNSFVCACNEGTTLCTMPVEYITPMHDHQKVPNDENHNPNQPITVAMPPDPEHIPMPKQIMWQPCTAPPGKWGLPLSLMHNHLGHWSINVLLNMELHQMYNDVSIIREPDSFCGNCHITLQHKTAQNKTTPPKFQDLQPGKLIYLDIMLNPSQFWLTKLSHFPYFLLTIDAASQLTALIRLDDTDSRAILSILQYYKAEYVPKMKHDGIIFEGAKLAHICANAGSQFISQEFWCTCTKLGIHISLAAPKHQEMNGIVEQTWQSICNLGLHSWTMHTYRNTFLTLH